MATGDGGNIHRTWNIQHSRRLAQYNARLERILRQAVTRAASSVTRRNATATADTPFTFKADRILDSEIDSLMKDLAAEITAVTGGAERTEWDKAQSQAVRYLTDLYDVAEQSKGRQDAFNDTMLTMRSRNLDALDEFQKRKIGGMTLSEKVWECTADFKGQMECAIDTALLEGKSAASLAQSVQGLLDNPDALFRRVRDAGGTLRLSKAAKAFHPGKGKYRSAHKNAMRLARTEINMAYRASDCNVAQMLDCVVGIRINLSNNHNCEGVPTGQFTDICDELAGDYPKDFKFTGWHPQCRCFITYINKTDEEFWRDLENGENNASVNTVKDVPDAFKQWVSDNSDRLNKAEAKGSVPYFIKDNKQTVERIRTEKKEAKPEVKAEVKIEKIIDDIDSDISMTPNIHVKKSYTDNRDINDTLNGINKDFTGDKWFNNGDCDIQLETNPKNNGSTNRCGKIRLTKDRTDGVKSALAKIGNSNPNDITEKEADSMATLWHEITHNRHIKKDSAGPNPSKTRDYMELANEYTARKTLPDFYDKLGCTKTPHPEFINDRKSTGYNSMVNKYDHIIKTLKLDEGKVLDSVKDGLFNGDYKKQKETLVKALKDGGIKKIDGSKVKQSELNDLVQKCVDDFIGIPDIDKTLNDYKFTT